MVLSMKPGIFKTIHPDTFVIPTNPGPAPDPVIIAAASTATKIADIYKAYALESAIYTELRALPYGNYLTTWSLPTPRSTSLNWKRTRKK